VRSLPHVPAVALSATLLWAANLSGQTITVNQGEPVVYARGKGARLVPPEVKLIEEKSLEHDANLEAPATPGGNPSNAAKYFAFELAPKEKLSVKLQPEDPNQVGLMAIRPVTPDKMRFQYERLDRIAKPLRSSRFEIENVTEAPYIVVLMVHGHSNYWYRLAIERKR